MNTCSYSSICCYFSEISWTFGHVKDFGHSPKECPIPQRFDSAMFGWQGWIHQITSPWPDLWNGRGSLEFNRNILDIKLYSMKRKKKIFECWMAQVLFETLNVIYVLLVLRQPWSKDVVDIIGIFCLQKQVSKKNLMEIAKKLMVHMDKAEGTHYRDELLAKIVEISSQSNYQYITNFEWYVKFR